MVLGLPIPAWIYFCWIHGRWYAAPILMLLITTHYTGFIEDIMLATCNIPEYPTISSSFICYFVRSRASIMGHSILSPTNIGTQQDVLARSFFSNGITSADLSIGDVIFLVESSQLDRHEAISGAVKYLKDESILLTVDLLGLRVETSYHSGLVMGASDELLKLVTHVDGQQSTSAVLCAMRLYSCPDYAESRLDSLLYLVETLSNALISLELLINRIEDGLRGLDGGLALILQLIAAESFQTVEAKNHILLDPLYQLGIRRSPQLLQYEARLQAVSNVLGFHRSATDHVTESRGRLSAIKEELKVLKRIEGELELRGAGMHLRSFVEALRRGLLRLQSAQDLLSGGSAGSSTVEGSNHGGVIQSNGRQLSIEVDGSH
ncbi:hypothetical protein HWV62_19197 [Athelia sp. TMB]|nr:hypothetical protein HWV62_19197 [Athelia sp. TMB]